MRVQSEVIRSSLKGEFLLRFDFGLDLRACCEILMFLGVSGLLEKSECEVDFWGVNMTADDKGGEDLS